MKRRNRKVIALVAGALIVAAVVPAVVVAVTFTNATAVGAQIVVKLPKATNLTFQGSGEFSGKVTCTTLGTRFEITTKASGLGPFKLTGLPAHATPTFDGCSDSFQAGDQDTVTTNGTWTLQYLNAASTTAKNQLQINIPQNGMTLVTSYPPAAGCTMTLPSSAGGAQVMGDYDNAGHLQLTNQSIPYSLSGSSCFAQGAAGTMSLSATLDVSPALDGVR